MQQLLQLLSPSHDPFVIKETLALIGRITQMNVGIQQELQNLGAIQTYSNLLFAQVGAPSVPAPTPAAPRLAPHRTAPHRTAPHRSRGHSVPRPPRARLCASSRGTARLLSADARLGHHGARRARPGQPGVRGALVHGDRRAAPALLRHPLRAARLDGACALVVRPCPPPATNCPLIAPLSLTFPLITTRPQPGRWCARSR